MGNFTFFTLGDISCHTLWLNILSVLIASTSAPAFLKSEYFAATAASSVGQANVKSAG